MNVTKENSGAKNASNDFLSLFENSEFDTDFDVDYLEQLNSFTAAPGTTAAATGPAASVTRNIMSTETRGNLQKIQEKTIQLEKERRGFFNGFLFLIKFLFF